MQREVDAPPTPISVINTFNADHPSIHLLPSTTNMISASLGSRSTAFNGTSLHLSRPKTRQGFGGSVVIEAGLVGYGKKWEHLPVNKNNKVERVKMHVKTGDHVIVITGAEKGTTGDITKVDRKTGKVWLEGVNMKLRFRAPESEEEKGSTYKEESPIHHSNVMHYSKEKKVRSRMQKKTIDGKKVRVLVKTGEVLPN